MKKRVLFVLPVIFSQACFAQLGVQFKYCDRSFGTKVAASGPVKVYTRGSLEITVKSGGFNDKYVTTIVYKKKSGERFSADEVKKILRENRDGDKRWTEIDPWADGYFNMSTLERKDAAHKSNDGLKWVRSGRDAVAFYSYDDYSIRFDLID